MYLSSIIYVCLCRGQIAFCAGRDQPEMGNNTKTKMEVQHYSPKLKLSGEIIRHTIP